MAKMFSILFQIHNTKNQKWRDLENLGNHYFSNILIGDDISVTLLSPPYRQPNTKTAILT